MFFVFFVLALVFRLAIALALKSANTHTAMETIARQFHGVAQRDIWDRHYGTEMEAIAVSVVEFGDYNLNGVPTAHCTPVFPLYLAGLFAIFGTGLLAQIVKIALCCAVSALRCGLVPLFALDAGLDPRIAALVGGIGVLYIGALETEISGGVDGPFVALALLILVWAILRIWRDGSWQTRTPWWFFAFCGFCALLNPNLLPVMGGFLLAGAIACPAAARKRYLRQTALVALGILVFLLPWAIRNYSSLGAPILTRSNFGLEFWLSNGPGRTFDLSHNYGTFHPSASATEAACSTAIASPVDLSRSAFAEWVLCSDLVRFHFVFTLPPLAISLLCLHYVHYLHHRRISRSSQQLAIWTANLRIYIPRHTISECQAVHQPTCIATEQ
jgi:hypothetical protein